MDASEKPSIVLISGSLRARSTNSAVITTAAALAPADVKTLVYAGMADLPHFNPDDDRDPLPDPVSRMRALIGQASAVMLSTPEYAGCMPGAFKNLLDWTVGAGSLYQKPVGWINPSAHGGAGDAYNALRKVLDRAGAVVIDEACATIPVSHEAVDETGNISSGETRKAIAAVMQELAAAVRRAEKSPS